MIIFKTHASKIKRGKRTSFWDGWTITAIILVVTGILAVFFPWNRIDGWEPYTGYKFNTKEYDKLGAFITGVSTPLFGLATLIMLVRTYTLQKRQLSEADEAMNQQMRMLQKQRFDDNFFRLMENHHRIVEAMDLHKDAFGEKMIIALKRDCFRTFYLHMKGEFDGAIKTSLSEELAIKNINKIYDRTQEFYKADLHHYFRFIYHILKYVKHSDEIDEGEKYKYTSILRATLSPYELVLIFYNCLHEFGDSHFRPLVEEFSFLKNLDKKLLFIKGQKTSFDDLAFAKSSERPDLLKKWKEKINKSPIPK